MYPSGAVAARPYASRSFDARMDSSVMQPLDRGRSNSTPYTGSQPAPYNVDPNTGRYAMQYARHHDASLHSGRRNIDDTSYIPTGMVQAAPSTTLSAASYPRGIPSSSRYPSGTAEIALHPASSYDHTVASASKYECEYCKKRFTRPSSLKVCQTQFLLTFQRGVRRRY
jgi:hypothetical protein